MPYSDARFDNFTLPTHVTPGGIWTRQVPVALEAGYQGL